MVLTPQGVGRVGRREGFLFIETRERTSSSVDGSRRTKARETRCDESSTILETAVGEDSAGVTQLVECHLAKVDVESSNLFSRSK